MALHKTGCLRLLQASPCDVLEGSGIVSDQSPTTERRPIRLLDPTLINQIAAGEVIVRPASVIKELLENAVDAEATRVVIVMANDGRDITVTDDGVGIPPDQIETAFERHATSKIASFEDITRLDSRGFRGEALASIASVAKVRLTSRTPDSEMGTVIEVVSGTLKSVKPTGAPPGTRVEVTDLFGNVPARRKFLRSPQAEFNAALRIVVQQALSQPEVGIVLERETDSGRNRVLDLPPDQTLRDRLAQVMGAQVAEHLVPIDLTDNETMITGFIARPLVTRHDSRGQHFFVGGRPISNRRLGFALKQALTGMIMVGRHPIAAIFIECPPETVDVNVHPTKEEVRFDNEDKIAGLVYRAVQGALGASDLRPQIQLGPQSGAGKPPQPYSLPPESATASPMLPLAWGKQAAPFPSAPGEQSQFPTPPPAPTLEDVGGILDSAGEAGTTRVMSDGTVIDPLLTEGTTIEPLGQIDDTYIVAKCGNDMLLIDQHAAHERLMYHRVIERFRHQRRADQPLLVPLSFDLPATALSHLDEIIPAMQALGIEIESFGGQTVMVRSIPADFEKLNIAQVILDIASDLESGSKAPSEERVRDALLTRMACHAAIKANRKMDRTEMQALIDDIVRARLPHTCPHGRPTMALLTRDQLDRQFKRH